MLHLSRLAEDWILYSSEEFGWLELGDDVTSGSSLMPQKKNPDSLELIRGKSGRVLGCLHSLMVTMKGLPLTYNRDMQEDKEPLFDAADQVSGSLEMARAVIESARLNPARPLAAAQESWVVATDLAEALARAGTPFHQAHQLVGRLVLESVRSGKQPADWTAEELQRFAPEFTPDMARLLDPREGMRSREIPGGTGPQAVAQALRAGARAPGAAMTAMSKSYRHGQILKLIRAKSIHTQDELARELQQAGIAATQVTLSRDIRDLRLVKTREGYREIAARGEPAHRSPRWPPNFCTTCARAKPGGAEDFAGTRQFRRGGARYRGMAGSGRHARRRRHHPGDRAGQRHRGEGARQVHGEHRERIEPVPPAVTAAAMSFPRAPACRS